MVGALSCISTNTMAFLALSLIREAQSVSVVRRGYRASLHSPADTPHITTHREGPDSKVSFTVISHSIS